MRLFEKPKCLFYSKCLDKTLEEKRNSVCPKNCDSFIEKENNYNTYRSINWLTFPVLHFQPNQKIYF